MTIRPISSGLMLYFRANPRAIGAMIATAPGLTAPTDVRTAEIPNMIHGMAAIRPRTALTAILTSQSIVPLFWAMAKRKVIPTRVRNSPPGKPAMIALVVCPATRVPTRNAPTKARTPMLTGRIVATTNIRTRA